MEINLSACTLCPHMCKINRNTGKIGRCRSTANVKIALSSLHHFEEPCISGKNGSGTVFFSNCNLSCVFCQNYKISRAGFRARNIYRRTCKYFFRTARKRCRKH